MPVKIIPKENQGSGQFNYGEILENKPIGFPQDGGEGKPYSNLFYWAHAWTPDKESVIGEHPHQGFEIMSFVLKGSIEHFDNKHQGWKPLEEGDAQIIRAGDGITHAEKVNEKSEFFQIWFDPDLDKTLRKPASYNDYPSKAFPVKEENGMKAKIYKGEGSPVHMDSPGVTIKELTFEPGEYTYKIDPDSIFSAYLISGNMQVEDKNLVERDFVIVENEEEIKIQVNETSKWFTIQNPAKLDYLTYVERVKRQFN